MEDVYTPFERGLAVIQAFSSQHPSMSISGLSQKTGIPRAAVSRCLHTLRTLGLVSQDDRKNFSLTPKILSLGFDCFTAVPLSKASQSVLNHVTGCLNETSSLAVLDRDEVLCLARATSQHIAQTNFDVGVRLPASCTAAGRVILSHQERAERESYLARVHLARYTPHTLSDHQRLRQELEAIRVRGYAICDQELELGLRSIAVPVLDANGRVKAALSVVAPASRVATAELEPHFLPVLYMAAWELGMLLG